MTYTDVTKPVNPDRLHAEFILAQLDGYKRTLRDIRDKEGLRNRRASEVWPGEPVLVPDHMLRLTHEQRFRRVVRALHFAGYPPSIRAIEICCFRAPIGEHRQSGGWSLNGRESRWRREELLALGYTKDGTLGRWKRPVRP